MSGVLYLVGTPIGNLADLSPRAADILKTVSVIAAEDTRHSRILLDHAGSDRPMISFHQHNEAERIPAITGRLERGESVAVISDAGNPGISDPAERLVRAAIDRGFPVVPVAGPSAFLAALIASGLPSGTFRFEGYPPAKQGKRNALLDDRRGERATLVFYESPRRVKRFVGELAAAFGERRIVLAREITKKFEEFFRGTPAEVMAHLEEKAPRGEYVVLVEGAGADAKLPAAHVLEIVREELAADRSLRDAVRTAALLARWKEQEVYRLVRE